MNATKPYLAIYRKVVNNKWVESSSVIFADCARGAYLMAKEKAFGWTVSSIEPA